MRICYLVKIPSISRNYKDLSITDAELLEGYCLGFIIVVGVLLSL